MDSFYITKILSNDTPERLYHLLNNYFISTFNSEIAYVELSKNGNSAIIYLCSKITEYDNTKKYCYVDTNTSTHQRFIYNFTRRIINERKIKITENEELIINDLNKLKLQISNMILEINDLNKLKLQVGNFILENQELKKQHNTLINAVIKCKNCIKELSTQNNELVNEMEKLSTQNSELINRMSNVNQLFNENERLRNRLSKIEKTIYNVNVLNDAIFINSLISENE
jgi:hypothetical protein